MTEHATARIEVACPYGFGRRVVVQEAPEGGVEITIADPRAMFSLVDNPALTPLVEEAASRLRRVIESLA